MPGAEHTQRASKPAPTRYGTEANLLRPDPHNQDTPEATTARPSGELLAETLPELPSASSRQSGQRAFFRAERLRKAKRLMRFRLSLEAVANIAGLSKAELDLELWNSLGNAR
jgi:hypothetical protein